ncbi:hypothetical protein [Pedobacter foliorum]|uniref:hypothetical protein n=1 Tax=Pedobacter foliorum TaxID=2739058 RepID=UPI00156447DC|nr:hypothetical protein [Pedobacter foliorum]NRF37439.1 hypothetical protein [Pedobacter foliorum]
MRHYLNILKDIEKYMNDNHLSQDLENLHDWQNDFTGEAEFCSTTATWLYTFQVYSIHYETLMGLIDEFGSYCRSKGINFT